MRDEVAPVEGVPRWFTLLFHLLSKKQCVDGHELPPGWTYEIPIVCTRCGAIVRG